MSKGMIEWQPAYKVVSKDLTPICTDEPNWFWFFGSRYWTYERWKLRHKVLALLWSIEGYQYKEGYHIAKGNFDRFPNEPCYAGIHTFKTAYEAKCFTHPERQMVIAVAVPTQDTLHFSEFPFSKSRSRYIYVLSTEPV